MKVIDFHLHINSVSDVNQELQILDYNIEKSIITLSSKLKRAKINKGMAIILDTRFLNDEQSTQFFKELIFSQKLNNLFFSFMVDFRKKIAPQTINRAASLGIKGIKFHPAHQKIIAKEYDRAKEIAILADRKGLMIIIDTHYVGYDCDKYSGLKLAKFISPHIKGPVILAHSGGLKVLEAAVLAFDFKNVYLDISFSIPFWLGSSIEDDFAFAIRKVGSDRCIYGSDAPFVDLNFAKKATEEFLINHRFSIKEREDIFYNTANCLLGKRSRK